MRMRAAVLRASPVSAPFALSRPLTVEEVELDEPGHGEVLVRVRATGLCHSDLSVIDGNRPRPVPMVLGHEAAGEVVGAGPGVDDLSRGDRVVMVFVPSCGHCMPCAEGRPALCEPAAAANAAGEMLAGGRRLSVGGEPIHHHIGVSSFAEYAVVSRHSLVKIDTDVPYEIASLFGCAVLTGVGAVVNSAKVKAGETVAVVGLGGVGLSALLGAVAAGASRIIAVDLSRDKLTRAGDLGATDVFNAGEEGVVDAIRALTRGGVDHSFEMAGSVKALDLAFQITCRGGTTTTAGLANPNHTLSLSPTRLVAEERRLQGSYLGSCVPTRDIPRFIALYRRGKLPVDKLWTSSSSLETINEGFDALHEGRTIRHVITM
ncbi:zinc-dependent alcohol dehydrogenase family protein [Chelatococcus asaccharovorans]|uniref:zinc-dependent alcohol dehydrogenase family protein n=1 Tax=Chelatococcus asaccharovorans TaxID=28210 RepID=UPI00224C6CBD|nr:zinc-dependent alcohol dehydrogenase family protein [Chelatococcus asaccharovorans]CAH1657784.1 Alcohol dehydrogenase [Chelatococcus asaccharovorans]CAH1687455.1 Alcohol dehydrogenase [Chelatococcus asaccharovorans]